MKKLSLLSKKFPFIKIAVSTFIFSSCLIHTPQFNVDRVDSKHDDNNTQNNLTIPVTNQAGAVLAELDRSSCTPAASHHEWSLIIDAPGSHTVFTLFVPIDSTNENASITSKDGVIYISPKQTYPTTNIDHICQTLRHQSNQGSFVAQHLESYLRAALNAASKNCTWKPANSVWHCEYQSIDLAKAQRKIATLNKRLTRHWKRVPYLFSRRLGITAQLAKISSSPILRQEELKHFCTIIEHSFPSELPLILRSKNWQKLTCLEPSSPKRLLELAKIGVSRAIAEISKLMQIAEQTSFTRPLYIRIPRNAIVGRNLQVELKPLEDVHKAIQDNRDALSMEPAQEKEFADCWHPLFDLQTATLATGLGLLASDRSTCSRMSDTPRSKIITQQDSDNATGYIVNSLVGETSFVVTNGYSKVLRLPEGSYSYTITEMPTLLTPNHTLNRRTTTGTIIWDRRHRASIQTWQNLTN